MVTIEQNESSELETFKHKVWEVASRYATLYDWCSVVEEALNELGVNGGFCKKCSNHAR